MFDSILTTSKKEDNLNEEAAPIFITGSVRSGTSIICHALLRGIKLPGYVEGCFIQHLGIFLRAFDIDMVRRKDQLFNDAIMASHVDRDEFTKSLCNWFKGEYEKWNIYPQKRWVDKTADVGLVYAMPQIMNLWPKAKCIFMKRRPIENILSRQKKFAAAPFYVHIRQWCGVMEAWDERKKMMNKDSYIEIDQYEIATNPTAVAERVQLFLDLSEDEKEKIEKYFKKNRPEFTGGDENVVKSLEEIDWSDEDKELFMERCVPIMKVHGWSLGKEYYSK